MTDAFTDVPTTLVIFGASGDLTRRKLVPALYNLYRKGRINRQVQVVGFARRPYSHEDLDRAVMTSLTKDLYLNISCLVWQRFYVPEYPRHD